MELKLRTENLDWKQIDDEIVALDVERAEYLSVDGSGVAIWEALAAGTTREGLIEAVVARYGIELARAAADIDAFIADLAARELLAH